ncbi:MAG TPA: nitroreductase family protein [Ilumatobacteraceae bacterium]|nr:nitroreductase family protein [Ilumatobacteraceae bacterium]
MEIREAIRTNGSVRDFTDEPVEDATITSILDDARFAPSGGNRQPWRVAVVKDPLLRRELATLMQPVWDEYMETAMVGGTPFNTVDYTTPTDIVPNKANALLSNIEAIPVVLAVAVDLSNVAMMDSGLDRQPVTGGASIYPFCWNLMLSARAHGLGGVMTTFLSRVEPAAAPALGLPEHHALVTTIFLGHPVHQPTKLKRNPVGSFSTTDRFDGPSFGS